MKKNYILSILIMLSGFGALSQLTAPFTESFNSGIPSTWNLSLTSGTNWVSPGTSGMRGFNPSGARPGIFDHTDGVGREFAWMDFSGGVDRNVIIESDTIDVSGLTLTELKFYYNCIVDGGGTLNPLNVLFVEVYNGTSWITIDSIRQDNAGLWSEHFYNVTPHVFSNKIVVRFRGDEGGTQAIGGGGSGSGFNQDHVIDDISIIEFSPCRPVLSLTTTAITSSSATAGWTSSTGFDTAWIVEYGPTGFTPGTGTTTQVSVNSANLPGLLPATLYDFYVTGLCSTGDTSAQVGPETFQTACLAGLSGSYTIDPASPTAGTNFNSFTDFFATVLNCGLDAATVVDVSLAGGPYVVSVDVPSIPGSSLANTLTINGNGSIINHGGGPYFMALNGVKHLTINDFNFVNETTTAAKFGIMMRNGCDSINITNNTFDMGTTTSSASGGVVASGSLTSIFTNGNNANNVTIDSNTFKGAYAGVVLRGASTALGSRSKGHKVTNNTFEDQSVYGMYCYASDSILIDNNDITRATRTNSSSYYGIYSWYSSASVTSNNKIHNVRRASLCYPMYLGYLTNTAVTPGFIVNNAVYDIENTSTFYGIYLYSFSTATTTGNNYLNIWHNTVTKNTTGTTSTTRGISVNTTTATYINNIDLTNNIVDIYGSGSGTKYAVYFPTVATFSGSNNVLYNGATAGTNNLGFFGSNQATLTAWNTASGQTNNSDANPIIIAPGYLPFSTVIDNFGTPLPLVPTDIDGATRNLTTPDPGVVEYVPSGGDISLTNAGLAQVDDCYGTADTAFVDLTNLFGDTLDFVANPVTVYFEVTGPINTTTTTVLNTDSLLVGDVIRVVNSTIDMSVPGKYSLKTYIDFSSQNILSLNDTVEVIDASEVTEIILITPEFDTLLSFADSAKLSTQSPFFPGGNFFISEICQFRTGTGSPTGGWPTYFTSDDYMEIVGVPGSDIAGYTIEFWSGISLARSYTFPAGTVVGPNGTLIFGHANANSSPSDFYYGMSPTWASSSGSGTGRVLKDPLGNIADAVAYPGSSGYTFPASSGVTAADWSGNIVGSASGTSGIKLEGADVNSPTNWVQSRTSPQDPNTLNTGVPIPVPTSVPGLTWTDLTTSMVIDTTPEIYAKGFTANGTYPIEAAFITPCGTFRDTAYITVLNQTFDTTIINDCDSFQLPLSGRTNFATGFDIDTLKSTTAPIYDSIFYVYDINIDTTNETITLVECDSFVSPSGKIWNVSGVFLDTIVNSLGCDSLMTFNLTVNYTGYDTLTLVECDTFIAPSGRILRMAGTYSDTIPTLAGCDSIIEINLSIINRTFNTVTATVCDSFVSPTTGTTWTVTGAFNDTIVNAIGCDSVTTYNITVNYSSTRTDNVVLCEGTSYRVGPSVYTTAGTYTDLFLSPHGCDSTIITNLSFFAPAVATVNYNFCEGDSVQVLGAWYFNAQTIMDTIVGGSSNGCDSITTHVITTRTVSPRLNLGNDVVACLDGGATIFASSAYDTYNWSDGGTTNILNKTGAGSGVGSTDYILTVTQASSGCTARDTVNITFNNCTGLGEEDVDLNVALYPNPTSDFVTIEVFDKYNNGELKLEILNSMGQLVVSQSIESKNQKVRMDVNNFSKGLYFVRISSDRVYMTKKLIIQK